MKPARPPLRSRAAIALVALAGAGVPAHGSAAGTPAGARNGALYSCTDERGHTMVSDRPIAECANRPLRVLGSDGVARRELPAPLTAEQRRQRDADERARQAEARERREVQARDRALLQAYPDTGALETVRQRQLAGIDEDIAAATGRLAALRQSQQNARGQAGEDPEKAPMAVRRRISELSNAIVAEEAFVARRRTEREGVVQRFAEDSLRLRTLLGAGASASHGGVSRPAGHAATR